MKHAKNLYPLLFDPIGNDVGKTGQHEFTRSWYAPGAPHVGMQDQEVCSFVGFCYQPSRSLQIILRDI